VDEQLTTRTELIEESKVARGVGKGQLWLILGILAAITVSEYLFAYTDAAYGIGVALFLALGIYVTVSVMNLNQLVSACAESLALIPLYILFTSSLPWFFISQQYLLPAVYSIIIGLCLWHIYQNKLSIARIMNLKRSGLVRNIALGLGIGMTLGTMEYFILRPAPSFPTFEFRYLFRDTIYMLLFVGFGEELLFRGLIQVDLMKVFGSSWGLVLAAAMFAVMHLTWRSIPELFFVFAAGLILGYVYWKTKSLAMPIIIHAANNVMLVAILPYLTR